MKVPNDGSSDSSDSSSLAYLKKYSISNLIYSERR